MQPETTIQWPGLLTDLGGLLHPAQAVKQEILRPPLAGQSQPLLLPAEERTCTSCYRPTSLKMKEDWATLVQTHFSCFTNLITHYSFLEHLSKSLCKIYV